MLDTNVLLHFVNEAAGHLDIERKMRLVRTDNMRLSTIGFTELRHKILAGPGRVKKARLERLAAVVASIDVLPFYIDAAERAAQLMTLLKVSGKSNNWPDVMIAGHAAAAGHTLVTDDAALLKTPGIRAVNWRT